MKVRASRRALALALISVAGLSGACRRKPVEVNDVTPSVSFNRPRAPLGSAVEVYTDALLLELETLGPLQRLEPGASLAHVERWAVLADVPQPASEADVEAWVRPLIEAG